MAELGSVFEADEGPRGPDLRVSVEVPRAALGASFHAPVPERLAADGELIERVQHGRDEPGFVELHLPESLPDRAILRLRGQGGASANEGESAGDLLVVVELVDRPPRSDERIVRSAVARRGAGPGPLVKSEGTDVTWWVLLGLAVVGAGVLAALMLL